MAPDILLQCRTKTSQGTRRTIYFDGPIGNSDSQVLNRSFGITFIQGHPPCCSLSWLHSSCSSSLYITLQRLSAVLTLGLIPLPSPSPSLSMFSNGHSLSGLWSYSLQVTFPKPSPRLDKREFSVLPPQTSPTHRWLDRCFPFATHLSPRLD